MTALDPPTTEWSQPFWQATRERRLVAQRCTACGEWAPTPRPRCPHCWNDDLEWVEPPLEPRLYSWALHHGRGDDADRMVALVDITPGLRVLSNVVGLDGDTDELHIDDPLELAWLPLDDGRALPQFRRQAPDATASAS